MLEKILENVINAMVPCLDSGQLEKLNNVLYIEFHGVEVVEQCTELAATGEDGDEAKIRMFLASKKAVNRQDATLRQYTREIRSMLGFLGKRLEDITGMDLRYYYGIMRERRHIKMSTMQTRLHYLSSFWDFLITEELVHSNPVKKVGLLKLEKTIKKPYSAEDMEALRSSCTTLRDRALVEFLYSTGVRVSEAAALNVGDIWMDRKELIVYGKGSKERRTYLTDSAKFYLRRYLQVRGKDEGVSPEEMKELPLFVTLDRPHGRLTVAGMQYMLRGLGKRAGVKNVHPHRFRRTIATDLLNRGMPIEQVKEFLGHEKLDTTMIYCTVKEEGIQASHRKFA
ncbi:tyrosine-type recombinase/integrase [Enterocloster sp. HCN-30185]|mgnify:CR=1 FL=1|jgi:integrase/recombinase XerD|uniref:tyrosine-type recombinase/integrase n=1 Tax=Enterocloster sp. HCN-30185 TaxID=3134663 RepID=UPI0030BDDA20